MIQLAIYKYQRPSLGYAVVLQWDDARVSLATGIPTRNEAVAILDRYTHHHITHIQKVAALDHIIQHCFLPAILASENTT